MTAVPVLRREVSAYSLLLHDRGWVANHDGNVSIRSGTGFLVTPTAVSKRRCAPDTIVSCDAEGKPAGKAKPPSEVALHAGAYRGRPDANAVIHAHPPYASAFALLGLPVAPIAMPEVVVSLGDAIPVVPLLLPKDPRSGEVVGAALATADVLIMTGNGILTIGRDLEEAFLRVELLEHYARILLLAKGLGVVPTLGSSDLGKLIELRRSAGLHREGTRSAAPKEPKDTGARANIRAIVEDEIKRALGGKS